MNFAVYLPPQAEDGEVPLIYWLSGLTCTEQNFIMKSGVQRYASEQGIIIVAPDTSPSECEFFLMMLKQFSCCCFVTWWSIHALD
jgi:S-formylglutathione hydrolase FrmB